MGLGVILLPRSLLKLHLQLKDPIVSRLQEVIHDNNLVLIVCGGWQDLDLSEVLGR